MGLTGSLIKARGEHDAVAVDDTLDMYAVPIVATINFSTKNLGLLDSDDFLGNPGSRRVVHYPPPV